jgi:hemolysin III
MIWKRFKNREEVINAITHGIGALLAVAGLVILVVLSSIEGTSWHIVSFAIFGSALVILYTVSTLYHGFTNTKLKSLFRKFDHMAIFLLIAATYTPFCLTVLNGWIGWSLFSIVWTFAISGIVLKVFATGRYEALSTALYVAMGWVVILFIKPVYTATSVEGFVFLMIGGALYSMGVVFFVKDKVRYFHGIWHVFVLSGSSFHFFSVLTLL